MFLRDFVRDFASKLSHAKLLKKSIRCKTFISHLSKKNFFVMKNSIKMLYLKKMSKLIET